MLENLEVIQNESVKKEVKKVKKEVAIKKEEDNLTSEQSVEENSSSEEIYTVSPDGKYKIYKSDLHSDRLEENRQNIPTITIPGWVVAWPHDIKPNAIANAIAKGYQFIQENEPAASGKRLKIPAGRTSTGETAYHYAMKIPESKHREIMMREEAERSAQEEAIKRSPTGKSSDAIYATEQMHFSRDVLGAKMK